MKFVLRNIRSANYFVQRHVSNYHRIGVPVTLEPEVEEAINTREYTARNHPYINNAKIYKFPPPIDEYVSRKTQEMSQQEWEKVGEFERRVRLRKPMPEETDVQAKKAEVLAKLITKGRIPDKQVDDFTAREIKIFNKAMKCHIFQWKPLIFNYNEGVQYLTSRALPEFSALCNVFKEIRKKAPNFEPTTLFDFGSGVGTVYWAVDEIWRKQCKEVLACDVSLDMQNLNQDIMGAVTDDMKTMNAKIYNRSYLPASSTTKYDMVVSSHSLFDLGDITGRCRTADILWRKVNPGGFLILIETGTVFGYSIIAEIRDYLLQMSEHEKKQGIPSPIHVFAPCPHDSVCPRYYVENYPKCNFPAFYSTKTKNFRDLYSFVVLQKKERPDDSEVTRRPRIISPMKKRGACSHCYTCVKEGNTAYFTLTKSKPSKLCFRVAKKSDWGDELPILYTLKKPIRKHDEQDLEKLLNDSSKQDSPQNEKPYIAIEGPMADPVPMIDSK